MSLSLDQFHVRRRFQIAGVALIGINVDFENHLGVIADLDVVERQAGRPFDPQLSLAVFYAVIGHIFRGHVNVRWAR